MSQRGKPLNSQARNIVLNVKDYFEREKANKGFLTSVKKVQERVSEATGVGRRTLNRISNQKREKGKLALLIRNETGCQLYNQMPLIETL